jgi:hypothetical protein
VHLFRGLVPVRRIERLPLLLVVERLHALQQGESHLPQQCGHRGATRPEWGWRFFVRGPDTSDAAELLVLGRQLVLRVAALSRPSHAKRRARRSRARR